MKTTNMLYPHALVLLYQTLKSLRTKELPSGEHLSDDTEVLIMMFILAVIPFGIPFIIGLIPIWYICDVLANIYEWICIKVFVDLVLWGMEQAEIWEREHKGK